jgi:hypothetical protein
LREKGGVKDASSFLVVPIRPPSIAIIYEVALGVIALLVVQSRL